MDYTNFHSIPIENFNSSLRQMENLLDNLSTKLTNSFKNITTHPNPKPDDNSIYNITFDKIEHIENEINKNILDLIKIKEYIETIINKYNNILSLYLNIKQSLNNHQLRSGLQGQIIQQINNTNPKTIKKIIKLLPKPITHLISRNKYVDTPFREKDICKSTQL